MKESNVTELKICPRCGRAYHEHPAVSRADNKTLICPECGTREALATLGIDETEQEKIIAAIHRSRNHT